VRAQAAVAALIGIIVLVAEKEIDCRAWADWRDRPLTEGNRRIPRRKSFAIRPWDRANPTKKVGSAKTDSASFAQEAQIGSR
jgi:hypothetical protein